MTLFSCQHGLCECLPSCPGCSHTGRQGGAQGAGPYVQEGQSAPICRECGGEETVRARPRGLHPSKDHVTKDHSAAAAGNSAATGRAASPVGPGLVSRDTGRGG